MAKAIVLLLVVGMLFSCSFNTKRKRENIEERDSFSYNWAMDKTFFKGIRLYPLEDTITSILESQKKGVYLEIRKRRYACPYNEY